MKEVIIVGTGAVAAELTSYIEDNNLINTEKVNLIGYLEYDHNFTFENMYKDVVSLDGFEHTFEETGKWAESTKTKAKKVFYIK